MVEQNGFHGMIEVEVFSNRWWNKPTAEFLQAIQHAYLHHTCLLYTSDAADEEDSVDLGGRRIIKKKKKKIKKKKKKT